MGACFDSVTIAACSTPELKEKFASIQDASCNDNGSNTYAGHIGIANGLVISDKVFKDGNSAEEWLSNNTQKWESAIAVKVGDFNQVYPKTESEKKQHKQFSELGETLKNWDNDIIKRVKAGKSTQRSCPHCQSKVTVSYLKSINCPVCSSGKFSKTDTDTKKLQVLQLKYKEMSLKVQESKKKYEAKNKNNYWLVGAMCAS